MTGVRIGSLALVLSLSIADTARADWFVTPYLGVKFAGDTSFFDEEGAGNAKTTLGAAAGWIGDGIFGIEGEVGYTPRFFERSRATLVSRSQVTTLMGSVIVTAPRTLTGYSLRPFVSGGGGLMHVSINYLGDGLPLVDSNLFGINLGGGAVGGLTARTSVRFDLRYFRNVSSDVTDDVGFGPASLHFWRAAVGLTIR